MEDTFPDIGSMSDQEPKDVIAELTDILLGKVPDADEAR
jgi:hypothetical protein